MGLRKFKLLAGALAASVLLSCTTQAFAEGKKVLHIASYHDEYSWTHRIDKGIQKGLKQGLKNMPHEYKVFYMDTKRKNKPGEVAAAAEEAKKLIKSWDPDLVLTSDDNATKYVASPLKDTGRKFVFTGVNNEPSKYSLPNENVTGILERFHASDGIQLLKMLKPGSKKIVMMSDDSITGKLISGQLEPALRRQNVDLLGVHSTGSFEEWKSLITKYQDEADAFYVVVYFTMKDKNGNAISGPDVLKWTREHSKIPEIGFWPFVTDHGGLAAIGVDGVEQGYVAARTAAKIMKGVSPSDIPPRITNKSILFINAKRARELHLKVPGELVESANIVEK